MSLRPDTIAFARNLAIQQIGYWRSATMPKTRAYHRTQALYFLRCAKTGVIA